MKNTRRYIQLFCEAIDKLLPEPDAGLDRTDDVLDLIMEQRQQLNAELVNDPNGEASNAGLYPPELMRR
jgi:DNA replication licensing factor MCM7